MSMTMKRILSLVLCFVMLVGYVPAGVLARAAETEISLAPVVEEAAVMEQVAAAEPAETNEVPVEAAAEEAVGARPAAEGTYYYVIVAYGTDKFPDNHKKAGQQMKYKLSGDINLFR